MASAALQAPALLYGSSLQQWRQLCYLLTLDTHDAKDLLLTTAELICTASGACACIITYRSPYAGMLEATYGVVDEQLRQVLAQAESRCPLRQIAPLYHDVVGGQLMTLPLKLNNERIGFLHVVRPAVGDISDDLQLVSVMLTNALARQVTTEQLQRTARRQAERSLAVQYAVTRVLADATTLRDAAPNILRSLCESLDWAFSALWLVDRETNQLQCSDTWHSPKLKVGEFEQFTRQTPFTRGNGLPGRVWSTGESIWVADVVQETDFPGALIAAKDRLRGAFYFPILSGNDIRGVVGLFSRTTRQPDPALMHMMVALGSQMGQFVVRKRVENALRETKERLHTVVAHAPVIVFALDHAGTFTLAQGKVLGMLGGDEKSLVGRSIFVVYHEHLEIQASARRALAGEVFTAVNHVAGRAFETKWTPVRGVDDRVTGVIGVATDITDRVWAEQALRESEAQFRSTFEQAAVGIAHVGIDGRLLRVNQRLCDILGYTRAELLTLTIHDLSHPDDRARDVSLIERVLTNETQTYTLEKRYLHNDGGAVWVNLTNSLARSPSGEPKYFISVVEDITERKQAEVALRESEERFHTFMDHSPAAASMKDEDGRYVYVSETWLSHFNMQRADVHGKTSFDLLPLELAQELHVHERAVIERDEVLEVIEPYPRADGTQGYSLVYKFPVRDAANRRFVGSVGIDITERVQAEDENARLTEALRIERDRLLRREVEVRTQIGRDLHDGPVQQVAVADLTVQYVRKVAQHEPAQLPTALDDLQDQLKRATQDLRTVLYELRPIGIAEEGVAGVLRQYISRARQSDKLKVHLEAPPTLRRADPDYEAAMFIIVREALNNVRKHANAHNVWITLWNDERWLYATVHDDGKGFDVVKTQANYVQRGSFGLLNMSERAQLIGGSCTITSELGLGTTVEIRIPLVEPVTAEAVPANETLVL